MDRLAFSVVGLGLAEELGTDQVILRTVMALATLVHAVSAQGADGFENEGSPRCRILYDRIALVRQVTASRSELARRLGFDNPDLKTPEMGSRAIRYVAGLKGASAEEKAATWRELVSLIARSGHTFFSEEFRGADGSFVFQAGKDFHLYSLVIRPDGTVWRGKLAKPLRRRGVDGAATDDVWPADYAGYREVKP